LIREDFRRFIRKADKDPKKRRYPIFNIQNTSRRFAKKYHPNDVEQTNWSSNLVMRSAKSRK